MTTAGYVATEQPRVAGIKPLPVLEFAASNGLLCHCNLLLRARFTLSDDAASSDRAPAINEARVAQPNVMPALVGAVPTIRVFVERAKDVAGRHQGGHDVWCVAVQRFSVLAVRRQQTSSFSSGMGRWGPSAGDSESDTAKYHIAWHEASLMQNGLVPRAQGWFADCAQDKTLMPISQPTGRYLASVN